MRASFLFFAVLSANSITPAQSFRSFVLIHDVDRRIGESGALFAKEKEDYIPEVSFGAEVVPDGQRPVNEYQDMMNAPLFGWGSNEVGVQGVSLVASLRFCFDHDSESFLSTVADSAFNPLCGGVWSCVSRHLFPTA